MLATIRVLVVDDSALIRQMLTRALSVDPRIEVVGTAKTGVEAISQAKLLSPDVITLDIEMPELTGIEALPHLRRNSDARVLMLSTIDDPDVTYEALSLGAVDFIPKPKGGFATSLSELSETLLKKIRTAYRVDPDQISAMLADMVSDTSAETGGVATAEAGVARSAPEILVAIAASTGGPPALEKLLSGMSRSLPAAYLIVQHLPAGFSASLARRLSGSSEIEVMEARSGMPILAGQAYLAPYGHHMLVETTGGQPRIHLDEGPSRHGVCPSADPLFESVAEVYAGRSVGVVLTGMGADGAYGLARIRDAGGVTMAQDEATSVVWGMPGAAAKSGAARYIVPVGLMATEVRRAVRGGLPR